MGIDKTYAKAYAKAAIAAGQKLPASGNVFLTVMDKDKDAVVPIAKKLKVWTQLCSFCPAVPGSLARNPSCSAGSVSLYRPDQKDGRARGRCFVPTCSMYLGDHLQGPSCIVSHDGPSTVQSVVVRTAASHQPLPDS